MLRLGKKELAAVVKTINSLLPKIPDTNSPQCCVKVEQTDFTNTVLTLSIRDLIYEHYLRQDGFETGGQLATALINIKDLHEKVISFSKAPVDALSLKLSEEGLTLEGICVEDGKDVVNHTTSCRLYGGAVSDLRVPKIDWRQCGEIKADLLKKLISGTDKFGGFAEEDQGNGQVNSAPVRLSLESGKLTAVCYNHRVLRQSFIMTSCQAEVNESITININGHLLQYLGRLAKEKVNILVGYHTVGQESQVWVKFEGDEASLSTKTVHDSNNISNVVKARLLNSVLPENGKLRTVSRRKLNPEELTGAFTVQESRGSMRQHLVYEEKPYLTVKDSQQFTAKAHSRVRVSADEVAGDWIPILVPYDFPALVSESSKTSKEDWESNAVIVEQRALRVNSGNERDLLYVSRCTNNSESTMTFICQVRRAEDCLDSLDPGD